VRFLYVSKPHIGLSAGCHGRKNARPKLVELGGEIRLALGVDDMQHWKMDKITGVTLANGPNNYIKTTSAIAIGHSAADYVRKDS